SSLIQFLQRLTYIRNTYPVLRRTRFLTGVSNEAIGVRDVTWIVPSGAEMKQEDWDNPENRCFGMLIDGRAQPSAILERGSDATVLLVLNGGPGDANVTLPSSADAERWLLLFDTSRPERGSAIAEPEHFRPGESLLTIGRSLLAFVLETATPP